MPPKAGTDWLADALSNRSAQSIIALLTSRRRDDRVTMTSASDEGGAYDRGVSKHLVGSDRHIVVEVGALAREFQNEKPGLRLVGEGRQPVRIASGRSRLRVYAHGSSRGTSQSCRSAVTPYELPA